MGRGWVICALGVLGIGLVDDNNRLLIQSLDEAREITWCNPASNRIHGIGEHDHARLSPCGIDQSVEVDRQIRPDGNALDDAPHQNRIILMQRERRIKRHDGIARAYNRSADNSDQILRAVTEDDVISRGAE